MAMPVSAPVPLTMTASIKKLIKDRAARRAKSFANADFAGALGHRDQHDVHDADAADGESDKRDEDENDGHGEGNVPGGVENRAEILDAILHAAAVTALQNVGNFVGYESGRFPACRLGRRKS